MSKNPYSFYDRCERPWPNRRMKNAVIIGHTTPTTAKIWIRTKQKGRHLLCLLPIAVDKKDAEKKLNQFVDDKRFNMEELDNLESELEVERVSEEFETNKAKDYTKVCEVEGLNPSQRYRYFLARKEDKKDEQGNEVEEWKVVVDAIPRGAFRNAVKEEVGSAGLSFRTLDGDDTLPFSFGLFSCHNPYKNTDNEDQIVEIDNMTAWDSLGKALQDKKEKMAFVIAGGDQCYTDGRDEINIWNYLYKVMHKDGDTIKPCKEDMLSWFRDIYRAYWGFPQVRSVYGSYPSYMIWDDHEIGDGWGSYGKPGETRTHPIYKVAEDAKDKKLSPEDVDKLYEWMFEAACCVYDEYQHSHNPHMKEAAEIPITKRKRHYHFEKGRVRFFVTDGRGHRDITRGENMILGKEQLDDFKEYVKKSEAGDVLFVVSAVPFVHTSAFAGLLTTTFSESLDDDIKDSWEYPLHKEEKNAVMGSLWAASDRGVKVCFLSGDVHTSALFQLNNGTSKIYQITSSAITYHTPFFSRLALRVAVADDGKFDDVSKFERLAYFAGSSYAMIDLKPVSGSISVSFYDATKTIPVDKEIRTKLAQDKEEPMEVAMLPQEISVATPISTHKLEFLAN